MRYAVLSSVFLIVFFVSLAGSLLNICTVSQSKLDLLQPGRVPCSCSLYYIVLYRPCITPPQGVQEVPQGSDGFGGDRRPMHRAIHLAYRRVPGKLTNDEIAKL